MNEIGKACYLAEWYCEELEKLNGNFPTNDRLMNVYVFFNTVSKLYKVGITNDLYTRFISIQSNSGCKLDWVVALELETNYDESADYIEKKLHTFYKHLRKRGEWFDFGIRELLSIRTLFWSIGGEWIYDELEKHLQNRRNYENRI